MRPLEILLTIANLSTLCSLVIPRLRQMHRVSYAVFVTSAIAIIQVVVEGTRWQMVPAYILTLALIIASALQMILPRGKTPGQSLAKRLVKVGLIFLSIILCIVSIVLPILLPVFHLAHPSGPYQIGTVKYHWTDTSRQEIFNTNSTVQRQLMAQVWYPVKGEASTARDPYIDDAASMSSALTQELSSNGLIKLPSFFFDHFKYILTHAIPSASVSIGKTAFPVLVYATGLEGFRQANMFQVEHLVSHGYIVVGLDQPYTAVVVTFPDGQIIRGFSKMQMQPLIDQSISPVDTAPTLNGHQFPNGIIPYLAKDISFTLNQLAALKVSNPKDVLAGHLDLRHIGVFGVSLGAMVAAEACHEDLRIGACLIMDAAMPADVVEAGLQQPGMWLTRSAGDMRLERERLGGWSEKDIQQTLSSMQAVYSKAKSSSSYYVSIHGMFHVNFTDAPYWSPLASQIGLTGPINDQRGFDIVNACSLAFFDRWLKNRPFSLLTELSKQYPEVHISVH